jgi:hypothetical protein
MALSLKRVEKFSLRYQPDIPLNFDGSEYNRRKDYTNKPDNFPNGMPLDQKSALNKLDHLVNNVNISMILTNRSIDIPLEVI